MVIKTKLTEKDFIRAYFTLIYGRVAMKIFIGFALVYLAVSILSLIGDFNDKASTGFFTPVFILIVPPVLFYISAKKNYSSNKRISELTEYRFERDFLVVKGESFASEVSWDKIYKVSQTKNLILIWQTRQIANVIPKRDIWEGQVLELKEILERHRVKNNL